MFRHPDEGGAVAAHRMFSEGSNPCMGGMHAFRAGSACVVQRDWHPSSGGNVLVAGSADGAGWMEAADGGRPPGVWSVEPKQFLTATHPLTPK